MTQTQVFYVLPNEGYIYSRISEQYVKGETYLSAVFNLKNPTTTHKRAQERRLSLLQLQGRLSTGLTNTNDFDRDDLSEFSKAFKALKQAFEERPECKTNWQQRSKKHIRESNQRHQNLLQTKGIAEEYKDIDFTFTPHPVSE